jgi:hypothetical protein
LLCNKGAINVSLKDAVRRVIGQGVSVHDATRKLKQNRPPISLRNFIRLVNLPPPNIVQFDPPNRFVPENSTVTLMWNIANCDQDSCSIKIESQTSTAFPWTLVASNLEPQGMMPITVPGPRGAFYKITAHFGIPEIQVQGKPDATRVNSYGISGGGPGQVFYFKMVNRNTWVNTCFVIAQSANSVSEAKTIVEQQYGGYTATQISYADYINGSETCRRECPFGYHYDETMQQCIRDS